MGAPVKRVPSSMVLRLFCSLEEEVVTVSRFVAKKTTLEGCQRHCEAMLFELIERDGSAVPFEGPRREHVPSVISIALEHQWVDSGSFVSHSLRLPLVLKAKANIVLN